MAKKHQHKDLKSARNEIYTFFESKGFIFEKGSKAYLSEAIKSYAAKHNEILIEQMNHLQKLLEGKK